MQARKRAESLIDSYVEVRIDDWTKLLQARITKNQEQIKVSYAAGWREKETLLVEFINRTILFLGSEPDYADCEPLVDDLKVLRDRLTNYWYHHPSPYHQPNAQLQKLCIDMVEMMGKIPNFGEGLQKEVRINDAASQDIINALDCLVHLKSCLSMKPIPGIGSITKVLHWCKQGLA